jgi:hypothetical protein
MRKDVQRVKDEVKKLVRWLRSEGVSEEEIHSLVSPSQPISRLVITSDFRVMLPDYNREIKMQPIHKAVYLLFLKHPEGIRFKELPDYREELSSIYWQMKTDTQVKRKIERSLDDLTNPLKYSISEKCTRIYETFVKAVGMEVAKVYAIEGKRGEARRIGLDRNLVEWDQKESPPDY